MTGALRHFDSRCRRYAASTYYFLARYAHTVAIYEANRALTLLRYFLKCILLHFSPYISLRKQLGRIATPFAYLISRRATLSTPDMRHRPNADYFTLIHRPR